jgi:hypothetical protein
LGHRFHLNAQYGILSAENIGHDAVIPIDRFFVVLLAYIGWLMKPAPCLILPSPGSWLAPILMSWSGAIRLQHVLEYRTGKARDLVSSARITIAATLAWPFAAKVDLGMSPGINHENIGIDFRLHRFGINRTKARLIGDAGIARDLTGHLRRDDVGEARPCRWQNRSSPDLSSDPRS